jgi:hypothetical protein
MAEIVRELDQANALVHLEPIDVAKGLVSLYQSLPSWTRRTARLSSNAVRVRDLFKAANDPNKFLFDDIPATFGGADGVNDASVLLKVVDSVREGLRELAAAYPGMLLRLCDQMLAELQVPNASPPALAELRSRAENIRQLAGDFRLEAFIGRVSLYDGSPGAFEAIASLAADKPPREWVDVDLDRAAIDVAEMAQKFLRAETFARVKDRPARRHAMAVMIGMNGRPAPMLKEFDLAESDRVTVDELISRVATALDAADTKRRNVILAALAELSVRYMGDTEVETPEREVLAR